MTIISLLQMKSITTIVDDCCVALSLLKHLPNCTTYNNDTQDAKSTKVVTEPTPSLHDILQKLPEEPEGEIDAELQVTCPKNCRRMLDERSRDNNVRLMYLSLLYRPRSNEKLNVKTNLVLLSLTV